MPSKGFARWRALSQFVALSFEKVYDMTLTEQICKIGDFIANSWSFKMKFGHFFLLESEIIAHFIVL